MNKSYFKFMCIGTKFKYSKCSQQPQITKKNKVYFLKSRSPLQIAKRGYVCLAFTIHLKKMYLSLTKYFLMKYNIVWNQVL